MSSLAVDELRSRLNTFIQSMTSASTTIEIIAAFRKENALSIRKAQTDLENIALTKMVNGAGRLRPSHGPGEQDLFSGFGVPITIPVRDEKGRMLHVPIRTASIAEAKNWANGRKRPPKKTAKQIEVQRLIEEIEPFAKDESTTVETALLASKQELEKQKG